MEHQLIEAKAELSRVEAALRSQQLTFQEINAALQECQSSNNALTFQLNQTRVESQIKDREIQRLRSAAPCDLAPRPLGLPQSRQSPQSHLLDRWQVLVRRLGFTLRVLTLHLIVSVFWYLCASSCVFVSSSFPANFTCVRPSRGSGRSKCCGSW